MVHNRGDLSSCRAFTLIELLIVCAIISILASIAVTNYSEAVTRAKVSRVKGDMYTLSTAVESYMVDNNKYPIRHHRWELGSEENATSVGIYHLPPFTEKVYDPDSGETAAAVGLHVLTTPIAYLTCLPRDIFHPPVDADGGDVYFGGG